MKNALLRWWIILWASIISSGFLFHYGLFDSLWNADQTKLSFLIISLYTVVSVYIGYLMKNFNHQIHKISKESREIFHASVNSCWFTSEAMTTLGMIGTVIGFLLMLGPTFAGIDIGNQAKMMEVITNMGSGMSTALTTTLVGLICSLLTKAQLVNLEYGTKSLH